MDSFLLAEAATRGVLYIKLFLEILQNSQENNCALSLQFYLESLAQVFSCEFCKTPKNTFL